MPLIITCSKCQTKWALSEDERSVFFKETKTKEQLESILCPECENPKTKTVTVHNVDIALLKEQQASLDTIIRQGVIDNNQVVHSHMDALNGLSNFLDACTDAVDEGEPT